MTEETLGQYIRRMRKERGLTQEELAGAVGITKAYICIIERGELTGRDVSVSPAKLAAIARSLMVPAEELFNRAGILPEGTLLVSQTHRGGGSRGADGGGAEFDRARTSEGGSQRRGTRSVRSMRDWEELVAAGYSELPPSVREEVKHFIEFRARQLKQERAAK